jgi:hypothetical protein
MLWGPKIYFSFFLFCYFFPLMGLGVWGLVRDSNFNYQSTMSKFFTFEIFIQTARLSNILKKKKEKRKEKEEIATREFKK